MDADKTLSPLEKIYQETDQQIILITYLFMPLILVIGIAYNNPILAFTGITVLGIFLYYTFHFVQERNIKNIFVATGLTLLVALAQFVTNGITEAKYTYFVLLCLLTLYQNNAPIVTASLIAYAYIGISFPVILNSGTFKDLMTSYLVEPQNVSWSRFGLTIALITFANFSAIFVAGILRQRTIQSLQARSEEGKQLSLLEKNQQFADEIAKGNFDFQYAVAENDNLGKSLINMRDNLRSAFDRDEQERFINVGLAEINEILRLQNNDLQALSDSLVKKMMLYLNAQQGAIYLVQGQNFIDSHLVMMACYAYERKKFLNQRIEIGQGLVGQCYIEKASIYLTVIPQTYQSINVGLGNTPPACVLFVPLIANEKVVGVLEIASMEKFKEFQRKFIEKIAENIATTIVSVKVNEETKKLYEEARFATEELQAREEEMRQNMEELQATQEKQERLSAELEKSQTEMEGQLNAINSLYGMIEFDSQGNILTANEIFLNMMGYKLAEIEDKHHRIFVEKEIAQSQTYHNFWRDLGTGIQKIDTFKQIDAHGNEIWLDASYTVVKNKQGEIVKIIELAKDATERIKIEYDLKANTENLRASEEELRQNMEELEATQEEMHRKQMELERQNQILEANETSMKKMVADLKKREKDLIETKMTFQLVIDNLPRGVFWKDSELRFLGCNKIFAKISKLEKTEDIVGKTDYDLPWTKEDSDAYRADDQYVIDNRQAKIDIEESQTTLEGVTTWMLTTKVPLFDKDDNCFAVLGMFEDITERKNQIVELNKKAEENQYLKQQMEQIQTSLEKIQGENEELKKLKRAK